MLKILFHRFLLRSISLLALLCWAGGVGAQTYSGKWKLQKIEIENQEIVIDSFNLSEDLHPYLYFRHGHQSLIDCFGYGKFHSKEDGLYHFESIPELISLNLLKVQDETFVTNRCDSRYQTHMNPFTYGCHFELKSQENCVLIEFDTIRYVYAYDSVYNQTVTARVKQVESLFDKRLFGKWNLTGIELNDSSLNQLEAYINHTVELERKRNRALRNKSRGSKISADSYINQLNDLLNHGGWEIRIDSVFTDEHPYSKEHDFGYKLGFHNGCNSVGTFLMCENDTLKTIGGMTTLVHCSLNFREELLNLNVFSNSKFQFNCDELEIINQEGFIYHFRKAQNVSPSVKENLSD